MIQRGQYQWLTRTIARPAIRARVSAAIDDGDHVVQLRQGRDPFVLQPEQLDAAAAVEGDEDVARGARADSDRAGILLQQVGKIENVVAREVRDGVLAVRQGGIKAEDVRAGAT